MPSASARVLREDDQHDMSREAVLLQWERKIEAAERSPSRAGLEDGEAGTVEELRPTEDATHSEPRRFERTASAPERRTIPITGRPTPARRRRSVMDSQLAQPDRIALWAFLLGLFLVAVAAGTAHT
jgi:hypothetical protein